MSIILDFTEEARALGFDLGPDLPLSPDERSAAISTWRGRMLNEHISARVFAGIIGQMMGAGISVARQMAVSQMINDELRHGTMCAGVVLALGGDPKIEMPPLSAVPQHADAEPLEALLRNVLSISCLSETVAVSLISAERINSLHPLLEETLKNILSDEIQHARFGWSLLQELADSARLTHELCKRLGDYLISAFKELRAHELAHLPPIHAPSKAAEGYGVCDGVEARAIFFDTVEQVIIPRLEEFSIPAQRAWAASFS